MASFLQRHRKKLLVTSAVTLLTVITTTGVGVYLLRNWLDQQSRKLQQQKFIKEQIKRKFQQTQQDSLYTVYELIPVVGLVLNKKLDLDDIVARLKTVGSNGEATPEEKKEMKTQLWNELKLKSITKLCCTIYTVSSLLLLTRVQLNILSRREYLLSNLREKKLKQQNENSFSQVGLFEWISSWVTPTANSTFTSKNNSGFGYAENGEEITEEEINYCNEQAFLSISWWLLNRGFETYYKIIEEEVREKFQDTQPNDLLSIEDFSLKISQVLFKTNEKVLSNSSSENASSKLVSILYPDTIDKEDYTLHQSLDPQVFKISSSNNTEFKYLTDELKKCLDSTVISIILENLINESYKYCMTQVEGKCRKKTDKTVKSVTSSQDLSVSQQTENMAEVKDTESFAEYKLALLTISCKDLINQNLLTNANTTPYSNLVSVIDSLPELDDMCASIYSNI